ncbi:hypothetical protein GQ600_2544 [Phytophthora cactorum]|nr:hypothetical protein GQ600_2544 [Phytophthora cactorum]
MARQVKESTTTARVLDLRFSLSRQIGTVTSRSTSDEGLEPGGTRLCQSRLSRALGINTGAIVGILVAYVILCIAACILCMDRMERFIRRLGLRR